MNEETQIYASQVRATPLPKSDELMALAKKAAPDPSIFEENPPIFWRAEISNDSLDAYGTRMMPSSLKNYAKDAKRGVSFQNSHRTDEVGIGYSLHGEFDEAKNRTVADFYTLTGVPETDAFVRKMRAGIVRDVSIGFYGGSWTCSICGGDMLDWKECYHMPLVKYEIEGEGRKKQVIATADIENARLSEVSGVFDGATDGAEIITLMKAPREIAEGRLKPQTVRFLEERYRIKLPEARVTVPGYTKEEQEDMTDEERTQETNAVRAMLKDAGIEGVEKMDVQTGVRALVAEVSRLKPLADDGTKYRSDLIEETLAEGVRAYGNDFKKEAKETTLRKLSIDDIKEFRDSWKAIADEKFPSGRQTTDTAKTSDAPVDRASHTPDGAYAS